MKENKVTRGQITIELMPRTVNVSDILGVYRFRDKNCFIHVAEEGLLFSKCSVSEMKKRIKEAQK